MNATPSHARSAVDPYVRPRDARATRATRISHADKGDSRWRLEHWSTLLRRDRVRPFAAISLRRGRGTDGIAAFPADHYALISGDHGAAWPGVGSDESAEGSTMDLAELQTGIATELAGAGVERLDLLGFDACLIAAYEMATTMAPLADRLVASSELEPGSGWDYRSLQVRADDQNATADDFGVVVDSFVAGNDPTATLALLDLTQMPALDEAMAAFTSALIERSARVAPLRDGLVRRAPDPPICLNGR